MSSSGFRAVIGAFSGCTRIALSALLTGTALLAVGCGFGTDASSTAAVEGTSTIGGVVHGGRQPVSGSTVTLWAAGEGGYALSASQLAQTVTDANGNFSMGPGTSATYTCPNSNSLLYLTALGGQPTTGITNNQAAFMMALGNCVTVLAGNPQVNINELSTIASMFAMQQFFTPNAGELGAFSTSASNITGLANAMALVPNLINTSAGTSFASKTVTAAVAGFATNPQMIITPEQAKLDVMADMLAACVNSTGNGSTACNTLFGEVAPSSTTTVQDTLQAAYYLATNPTSKQGTNQYISSLFGLVTTGSPFQPTLSTAPLDWSLAVTYDSASLNTAGNNLINTPQSVAVDGFGNIWVLNYANNVSSGNTGSNGNSVVELSPTGVPQAQVLTSNLTDPSGFIIDPNNNVWVSNYGRTGALQNSVIEYVSSSTSTKSFTTLTAPYQLASDGAGNVFVLSPNSTGTGTGAIQEIPVNSLNGATATTLTTGLTTAASNIAIDSNFNLWITGGGTTTSCTASTTGCDFVYEMAYSASTPHYSAVISNTTQSGGITGPELGISVDNSNNIWVQNYGKGTVSYFAGPTLTAGSASPLSESTNLTRPAFQMLDGIGNIWAVDGSTYGSNPQGSLYAISKAGKNLASTVSGFSRDYGQLYGLAIDQSGNVWVGNAISGAQFITEVLGAAAPVLAPLSAGLPAAPGGANLLATRP